MSGKSSRGRSKETRCQFGKRSSQAGTAQRLVVPEPSGDDGLSRLWLMLPVKCGGAVPQWTVRSLAGFTHRRHRK